MAEESIDFKSELQSLNKSNEKLVTEFNATPFAKLEKLPEFYGFERDLYFSHRDFDKFLIKLNRGEPSAIVSGLNPSGQLHIGHKIVFDCNLFFQNEYKVPVYIPLSDDESYVSKKVERREDAVENSVKLIRSMLAYGFDPDLTSIILDFNYPEIYNIGVELARKVTVSEVNAIYGYSGSTNIGLAFYPAIQAAHVLYPQIRAGRANVLVPIGPDEDAHLRLCRDIAARTGYVKPSVIHSIFMPDINGQKMSKSRPDGVIYFEDSKKAVTNKIGKALSGGAKTLEEHRKIGGDPDIDVSVFYLTRYFLDSKQSERLRAQYRSGELTSGDVKKLFTENVVKFTSAFQERFRNVRQSEFEKILMQRDSKINPVLIEMWGKLEDKVRSEQKKMRS